MVACVLSKPRVASDSVAHTFADCGNRRQASRAEPENAIISPSRLTSAKSSSHKASSIQGCTRLAAGLRDVISARVIVPASATAFSVSKPPMAPVVM